MKTLYEFLQTEYLHALDTNDAPIGEHVAGFIGAVQTWLSQPELFDAHPDSLVREAGRRPGDTVAQ